MNQFSVKSWIHVFVSSFFLFTITGCFPDFLNKKTTKDSKISNLPNYHSVSECVMSPEEILSVDGLKQTLYCLDPPDELKLKDFLAKLDDHQIKTLILDPLNEEILNHKRPERLYEIYSTYQRLNKKGVLDKQIKDFGKLTDANKKLIISFLKLFKDTLAIKASDSIDATKKKKELRNNLNQALRNVFVEFNPEVFNKSIHILSQIINSNAFSKLAEILKAPYDNSHSMSAEEISNTLKLLFEDPSFQDHLKNLLSSEFFVSQSNHFQQLLEATFGVVEADIRENVPLLASLITALTKKKDPLLAEVPTKSTYFEDLLDVFADLKASEIDCLNHSLKIDNPLLFTLKEIAQANPKNVQKPDELILKDLKLLLTISAPFCDFPPLLDKHYNTLSKVARINFHDQVTSENKYSYKYRINNDKKWSVLEPLSRLASILFNQALPNLNSDPDALVKGLIEVLGAQNLQAEPLLKNLAPVLSEFTERGVWFDLMLMFTSLDQESRDDLFKAFQFLIIPHQNHLKTSHTLQNESILETFILVFKEAPLERWIEVFQSLNDVVLQDPQVLKDNLSFIDKAFHMNDVHPFIGLMKAFFKDDQKTENAISLFIEIADWEELKEFLNHFSIISENGTIKKVLDNVLNLYSVFAEKGHKHIVNHGFDHTSRIPFHSLSSNDFNNDFSSMLVGTSSIDKFEVCTQFSLDYLASYQSKLPKNGNQNRLLQDNSLFNKDDPFFKCLELDSNGVSKNFLYQMFEFLMTRKMSSGESLWEYHKNIISKIFDQKSNRFFSEIIKKSSNTPDFFKDIFEDFPTLVDPLNIQSLNQKPITLLTLLADFLSPFSNNPLPLSHAQKRIGNILQQGIQDKTIQPFFRDIYGILEQPSIHDKYEKFNWISDASRHWSNQEIQDLNTTLDEWLEDKEGLSNQHNRSQRLDEIYKEISSSVRVTDLEPNVQPSVANLNRYDWENKKLQTTWTLENLKSIIDPVLKKIVDQDLIIDSKNDKWILDGLLNFMRYFTLVNGNENRIAHYKTNELLKWLHARAIDLKPGYMIPRNEKEGRVVLRSSLQRFSNVLDASNFTIDASMVGIPTYRLLNNSYSYLTEFAMSQGDKSQDLEPYNFRMLFNTNNKPQTLFEATKSITNRQSYSGSDDLVRLKKIVGVTPLPSYYKFTDPQNPPKFLSPEIEKEEETYIDKVSNFIQPFKSLSRSMSGTVDTLFEDAQRSIFNTRASVSVLKENTPPPPPNLNLLGYEREYGYDLPQSFNGGLEVLQDLFYEFYVTTPDKHKRSINEDNYLSFVLASARIDLMGLLGKFLINYPVNHKPLVNMFQAIVKLHTVPQFYDSGNIPDPDHAFPAIRELMLEFLVHPQNVGNKDKVKENVDHFWASIESIFNFYMDPATSEKDWTALRNSSLYGLAILNQLEMAWKYKKDNLQTINGSNPNSKFSNMGPIELIIRNLTEFVKDRRNTSNANIQNNPSFDMKKILSYLPELSEMLIKIYHYLDVDNNSGIPNEKTIRMMDYLIQSLVDPSTQSFLSKDSLFYWASQMFEQIEKDDHSRQAVYHLMDLKNILNQNQFLKVNVYKDRIKDGIAFLGGLDPINKTRLRNRDITLSRQALNILSTHLREENKVQNNNIYPQGLISQYIELLVREQDSIVDLLKEFSTQEFKDSWEKYSGMVKRVVDSSSVTKNKPAIK